jgi:hypothetical protein
MHQQKVMYQALLFYAQRQRKNLQSPPKTSVETLGIFSDLQHAQKVAAQAYIRNQHAYIGFGVMVAKGQINVEKA